MGRGREVVEKPSRKGYATDLQTLYGEVRIEYYRSRGPGGQRKNKKETAVRLKHLPSGMTAVAAESRYQAVNKRRAFQRLQQKLAELNKPTKKRIPTLIPLGEKVKRREEKERLSQKKRWRRTIGKEDPE
jgi:protein subunit release factor B